MTLPHCFCLCSLLCVVFRINVILSIYFNLDLKYTWTLTPKWIVFIFLNLWKLGEGGKMDKVLVMLAAGNAARKVNSIQKTMSFSFSSQQGGYNHLFFLHSTAVFLEGVSAFAKDCLRCSPIQPGSSIHGSWITLALCASKCVSISYACEDWGSKMIKTWLKRQTRKLEGDFLGSLGAVMFLVEYLNIYLILQPCFLFVSSFVQLPVTSTTNFWRTFVEVVT